MTLSSLHSENSLAREAPTAASTAILTLALAAHMGRHTIQDLAVKRIVKDHNIAPDDLSALSQPTTEHLPSATACFAKLVRLCSFAVAPQTV